VEPAGVPATNVPSASPVSPDGTVLKMTPRDNDYFILANGKSLMSNDVPC
jgi:hypothetical protein